MKYTYQNNIFGRVLKEIKKAIKNTKFENHVFLVGGAVRDSLLGKEMKDIDLCIDLPNGGIEFATWICGKYNCYSPNSNPCVFPKYGTAMFTIRSISDFSNINIECVQTRKEQYHSDSRKPETVFGTIEEDCARRDLTINSLYVDLSSDLIIDPSALGLEDLKNQKIRTPSDPNIVFSDDPLRMLRVIRFATKLGWGIDKDTWLGIIENTHRINIVSKERIHDELNKILLCDKPSIGISRLEYCGLLIRILPEIHNLIGVKQGIQHFGDVFEHTMAVVDNTTCVLNHRWASLLHDVGKPIVQATIGGKIQFLGHDVVSENIAIDVLKKLKFSNDDIKQISLAVRQHMRFKNVGNKFPSTKSIKKFINDVGVDNLPITLDVIHADNISHSQDYCMPNQVPLIISKIEKIKEDEGTIEISIPINGNDIMNEFKLKPSPKIGNLLTKVKDFVIDNPSATKDDCLAFVDKLISSNENDDLPF